jgi:hypothetical protein
MAFSTTRSGSGAAAASTYVATKQQTVQQQTGRILGGAVAMTSAPKPKGYLGMTGVAPSGGGSAPADTPDQQMQQQQAAAQAQQEQASGGGGGGGGQQEQYAKGYIPDEQGAGGAPEDAMTMTMPTGATDTKVSLWHRIINWITGKKTATFSSERTTMEEAAAMLVERARVGDQNAMAMLSLIGSNAKKGNAKAREALVHVERYIRHNPVVKAHKGLPLAAQAKVNAQSLAMAQGAPLTDDRIRQMASAFSSEDERHAFADGVNNHENGKIYPHDLRARNLGRTVGYARGLQKVNCEPNCPISEFSSIVGWELGE